jgi:phage shock protein PspC (stress-responsive transcriptional regulator)
MHSSEKYIYLCITKIIILHKMEKITMVNINNKDYKLTETAYMLLSDYNDFIKKTIKEKETILDLEIQISVIIDMELEGKGEDAVVDTEIIKEVIKVLKENQKIYYEPKRSTRQKVHKMHQKRKHKKHSNSSDLKRDTKAGVLGGVCAGLAKKLNIDPVLLRIIYIVLTVLFGIFFFIYIILWIVLPEEK